MALVEIKNATTSIRFLYIFGEKNEVLLLRIIYQHFFIYRK